MIVHIVMFDFKEENKRENIAKTRDMLEALLTKVPTLKSMEVGIDFNGSERAMDLSLISTFEDKEALSSYAVHPAHLEVVAFIKEVTTQSKVVDYEK